MKPVNDMTEEQYKILMYGSDKPVKGKWNTGANMNMGNGWESLILQSEKLYGYTDLGYRRRMLERFQRDRVCPACKGKKLKKKILAVKIFQLDKHGYRMKKGYNIVDVTEMSIIKTQEFFEKLKFTKKDMEIVKEILKEIRERLSFLNSVRLGYLNSSRKATILSGGESQRIKFSKELAKRETARMLYILDEPTTGLHFHDVKKLLLVLDSLLKKEIQWLSLSTI